MSGKNIFLTILLISVFGAICFTAISTIQSTMHTENNAGEINQTTFKIQDAPWFDTDWSYRQVFYFKNKVEGFQSKINITKNSGGDYNCSGNCNNNFSDIRFVLGNGTELPFWMEEKTDGNFAITWVKNTYNDSIVYLYYGNNGAAPASNMSNTWDYSHIWTSDNTGDFTTQQWDSDRRRTYKTDTNLSGPQRLMAKFDVYSYNSNDYGGQIGLGITENYTDWTPNNGVLFQMSSDHDDGSTGSAFGTYIQTKDETGNGNSAGYGDSVSVNSGSWRKIQLTINTSSCKAGIYGTNWDNIIDEDISTSNLPNANSDLGVFYYVTRAQDVSGWHDFSYDATNDEIDMGGGRWSSEGSIRGSYKWIVIGTYSNGKEQTLTTEGTLAPQVITNHTSGVGETNATIHGYLQEDNGENTILWMEWDENKELSNVEDVWLSNSSLSDGLGDVGTTSAPEFFKSNDAWHIIAGEFAGNYNGFTWNGSSWIANATVISGLTDASNHAVIETFMLDGTLRAISVGSEENFYGYDWNGAGWDTNTSLVNGLSSISYDSPTPTIFNNSGMTQLIAGSQFSGFFGYDWNGSSWISNSSRINGLTDVGSNLAPEVFLLNERLRLISGVWNGNLYGWRWNGSAWESNSVLVEGISAGKDSTDGIMPKYTIFNEDGWKAIAGRTPGNFYGFDLRYDPADTEISVELTGLNPGQLYWYRAGGENKYGIGYGENKTFLTRPYTPSGLHIQLLHNGSVNLTWTKGNGANNTIIERNSVEEWSIGEGTELYNGTGETYIDNETSFGNIYYYQIWSQANWTYNPTTYQLSDAYLAANITAVFAPNVTTNHSTNIESNNATIHGYLADDGGERCEVWFVAGNNGPAFSCNNSSEITSIAVWPGGDGYTNEGSLLNGANTYTEAVLGWQDGKQIRKQCDCWITNAFNTDNSTLPEVNREVRNITFHSYHQRSWKWRHGVYIDNTAYFGDSTTDYDAGWDWYNETWETNPATNNSFTTEDIKNMQIITDTRCANDGFTNTDYFYITVNYYGVSRQSNETFSANIYELDPGQLYWYRAVASNSNGTAYGENNTFLTLPDKPEDITSILLNDSAVNISWSKGEGTNNTIIERKMTEGGWQRGEGEEIYNGTGTQYIDTNVSKSNTYYYQAWSQANWTYNPTIYSISGSNMSFNISMNVEGINITSEDAEDIYATNATIVGHVDGLSTSTIAHGDLQYDGWIDYASGTNEGWRKHAIKVNATDLAGKDGEYITKLGAYIHTDATSIALIEGGSNPDNGNELRSVNISSYDTGWMEVNVSPVPVNLSTWYWVEVAQPPWASNNGPTGYDKNAVVAGSDQSTRSCWAVSYGDGSWPEPNPDIWHDTNNYWYIGQHARAMNIYMLTEGGTTFAENCTVWFEWGKTIALGNRTTNQTVTSDSTFYQHIEGLQANTTYFYQAFGNNSNYSDIGTIKNFTTQPYFGPVLSDESPLNNHDNVAVNHTQLQINITDPDDTTVSWEIETSPNIGSASGTDDAEGIKMCSITTLSANTTYQWYVNATDGITWTNETYAFSTSATPLIGSTQPTNGSYRKPQPNCSMQVVDENGDNVTAIFYENTTGSWKQQYKVTVNAATPTVIQWNNYTNATTEGQTYWWKANITDGKGNYKEEKRFFTIKQPYILSDEAPYDDKINVDLSLTQLAINISDPDALAFNVQIATVPDIGSTVLADQNDGRKYCPITDMQADTNYRWYINVSGEAGTYSYYYSFNSTKKPYVDMEFPANGTTGAIQPTCHVRVHDPDGADLTVRFYENATNTWLLQQTNAMVTILDETDYEEITWDSYWNAIEYDKTYYWKVVVEDEKGALNSSIFHFETVDQAPIILHTDPTDNATNINVARTEISATITDPEGHSMDWSIETVPDIGNASGTTTNGTIVCPVAGLLDEMTCTWYVNLTDGYKWTNQSFAFNTSEKPIISSPDPENGTTTTIQPICSIVITDTKDGNVTVQFLENTTGSYVEQYTIELDAHTPQQISWQYTNATTVNTSYWWKIIATNEMQATTEKIYYFDTDDSPSILSINPNHQETNIALNHTAIQATIEDPNGDPMAWSIETVPDIGNASGTTANGTISCGIINMSSGMNYTWHINISDGDDWTNKTYAFTTSYPPSLTAAFPVGEHVCQPQPTALVEFDDPDGGMVNVSIASNASGSWHIDQLNTSISLNNTKKVYWTYTNATGYETKYWWQVNITDGKGNDVGFLFNFTTSPNGPPLLQMVSPTNGSSVETDSNLISLYLIDEEGDAMDYTIETAPNAGGETATNVSNGWVYVNTPDIQPNTAYTWYMNVSDGYTWTREWYTFTTNPNNASAMENPQPANGSTNLPLTLPSLNIDVYDIDGDNIQWSIETAPDIGSEYHGYQSNGTKSIDVYDMQPGTTYTWYVNITDGGTWVTEWFTFTTSHMPTITNPYPSNNSAGEVNIHPTCQITIDDQDNDPNNITVQWYTNETGSWTAQQTNSNISHMPTAIGYQYIGADAYNASYWWKVNTTDGKGNYREKIFTFATKINEDPVVLPTPANNSINNDIHRDNVSITITDEENHIINWTIETTPAIGSASGTNESIGTKVCPITTLDPDTQYTWFVNITDEYGATINKTYYFNTTRTPNISNEYPMNNSIAPYQPNCSFNVIDEDGGEVSVTFYEYAAGNWTYAYGTTVDATTMRTITWERYENASTRGEWYRWKVFIEDEKNASVTKIYNFTVNYLIETTDENPSNYENNIDINKGQIIVDIKDRNNQTINWSIETAPTIGNNSGSAKNGTRNCTIDTLQANTTYFWWVNASDGIEPISQRYEFSTGNRTSITNETPPHQSTGIPRRPACSITINDPDNDSVSVQFYAKQGGSWILQQTNSSIDGTHDSIVTWPAFSYANTYNTNYEWKVIVVDEKNISVERTYEFTTIQDQLPQVVEIEPNHLEDNIARTTGQLRAWVTDAEGHLMNWTIETIPDVGSSSGTNDSDGNFTCAVSGLACETTYTWHLNISDGYRSIQHVYRFDIARKPRIIHPSPANGEQYISRRPPCNVSVYDPDENQMDVLFYEYQNGSWIEAKTETGLNGSITHNIVWPEYSNASAFNTSYQWKVVAENIKGCVEEEIYSFTTRRDWIDPTIHWVNVSPSEVQVGMPIEFTTKVTDEGGSVDNVKLCLSSLGTNISMIDIGNNTYKYITNFSTEGNYLFYIQATDTEGNTITSDFYSFTIIVKVLSVRMYALERVLRNTENQLLIQLTHAKRGTQMSGLADNISIYITNPDGDYVINGEAPTEVIPGLYMIPFNHSYQSGTYIAWTTILYNDSEYMDATSFELRVEEFYNVSGLTDRMEDVFAATSQQSHNSTEEIISHLRQVGIETGALETETEKFGLSNQFFDTAISTIFQWIFMTLFLLGIFIVGTFVYGRRKGSKLAKRAANVPKAVVSGFTD